MTCGKNHIDIFWDGGCDEVATPCPVCDALADLARVSAELEDLKAHKEAREFMDTMNTPLY